MGHEQGESTVLVVGDDAELGQLIALNLRQRGLVADYAGLATAQAARWSPSVHDPALLIIDLENPEQVSPAHLHRLARQPWAERTTFLLAAEDPGAVVEALGRRPDLVLSRPAAVADIIAASRLLLGHQAEH